MKWIKRIIIAVLLLGTVAVLHYNLPGRDIVQITGTEVKRMDVGDRPWFWAKADAGTDTSHTRDVRFINAEWPNGKPRVYRNEDTDWGFPPYFKFDSGNLNAQAQGLGNRHGNEDIWVAVSHYGWRIELFSMYPNAYKIKKVSGPDAFLIPWFNIVFLTVLLIIFLRIFLWFRGLKKKHVDPVTDKIGDAADAAGEEIKETREGARKAFRKWFGTSKKSDTPKT